MQLAISVAGAAIGFAMGGPAGAQWGWMAGTLAGAILFPPHVDGPHMGDLKVQGSTYGQPIPVPYGMSRMSGNVIWAADPVEHSHTQGGKGGPEVTTYSYSESFAVGICEGPIVGVRRIWASGKLIYDMTPGASSDNLAASAMIAAPGLKIYLGDETQVADPTMESHLGVGNVPAHRGMAYAVFTDHDLSPYGNNLPMLSFEVVTAAPATWSDQLVATWSVSSTLGTFFSAPYLDPNNLQAMAWGYYLGFTNVQLATITPYGTSPNGALSISNPGDFPYKGRSDTPGALVAGASTMNWFDYQGVVHPTAIPNLPPIADGSSFVKSGNVIWATSNSAGGPFNIYRGEIDTANLVTSSTSGAFSILGVSASYLYVANATTGAIYRYYKDTLALVSTVMTSSVGGGISSGQVVNDSLIYVSYSGTGFYKLDLIAGTATAMGQFSTAIDAHSFLVVNDQIIFYTYRSLTELRLYLMHQALDSDGVPLSTIVSDICTRVGLQSSQFNVAQLSDKVLGYTLSTRSSAKSFIQPLMAGYFFDATDTDAKLKFVKRGSSSLVTIPAGDMGAANDPRSEEGLNPLIAMRTMELELPQVVELTYFGWQNNYDSATQRAFRMVTSSMQKSSMQLPVVLQDQEARQRCELMLWSQWTARTQFSFTTTLQYLKYEPCDVVTVTDPDTGDTFTVRLTKCENNGQGQLKWTALSEDPTIYTLSQAGVAGYPGYATQTVGYAGPTKLVVLDVPPLRDTDTTQKLYVGACGLASNWPGATVQLSRDGGLTYTSALTMTTAATVGFTTSALTNFTGGNQPDELSTVTVELLNGTLSSTTYSGLYAGTNAAMIGGELVFFRDATLISASTYRLSGFLRARQGTEWARSSHAVGDLFVLLSSTTLATVPLQLADLGNTLKFLPITLGQTANSANAVSVTVSDACVRPLAPSGTVALAGSSGSTSDITLNWTRRARVNAAWLNGTDVPLDESSESYQVQVFSGSTLKRTVTITAVQTWVYSAANITADGFTAGQTITLAVAQNSDQGVLGRAATTTIVR
jgi:hypothetical protein